MESLKDAKLLFLKIQIRFLKKKIASLTYYNIMYYYDIYNEINKKTNYDNMKNNVEIIRKRKNNQNTFHIW